MVNAFTVEEVITILRRTPEALLEVMDGASPEQMRAAPRAGEWSAHEVFAHLRGCADVWGSIINEMLARDRPRLLAGNPRSSSRIAGYLELDFVPSLNAFAEQRAGLLATLGQLTPDGWARTAIVKGAGKANERPVLTYAQKLAGHEGRHLRDISRILKNVRG